MSLLPGQDPWSTGMEGDAFDARRFGLEFNQHFAPIRVGSRCMKFSNADAQRPVVGKII